MPEIARIPGRGGDHVGKCLRVQRAGVGGPDDRPGVVVAERRELHDPGATVR
jgi:hypothetical protein